MGKPYTPVDTLGNATEFETGLITGAEELDGHLFGHFVPYGPHRVNHRFRREVTSGG